MTIRMLKAYAKLEFQKHWKSLTGVSAIVFSGIVLGVGGAFLQLWELQTAYLGLVTIFIVATPVFAVLFGVVSGSQIRRDPEKYADEILPISATKKISCAYFVSLSFFLFVISV